MAHMQHTDYDNASRMSRNQEPEMYPMHAYHGDIPKDYNVSVLPGQNRESRYGVPPTTNEQFSLPRAHLRSHPQEPATHGDNEYRHQGDNTNVIEGLRYPAEYGVPPTISSQPNVYSVITSQPEAYAGQIAPSGQWITPTAASGPNTYDVGTLWQSKGWLIFKRAISIVFMVTDIVLAWVQVTEMDKTDYSIWYLLKYTDIGCPQAQPVIVTYKVLMSFCTLFTIAQIINVIGETIYDLSEGQHGFQLLHGFNEVVFKMIIKDIPQFLLMFIAVFYKCTCTSLVDRWLLFIAVTCIPLLSCSVRHVTCKQEVKNWCTCNAEYWSCEECGCACPYICCYLPICTKLFNPCVPISFFQILGCCENSGFKCDFTPRSKDPVFALKLFNNISTYASMLVGLNILVMIVRCDIPINICESAVFRCRPYP